MNIKRLTIAAIAIFVFFQCIDYVFHGIMMADTYAALKNIWRADMLNYMWLMSLSCLVFSFAFVYIFAKGYEGKGIAEGIRYGVVMTLLINVMGTLGQFAMYPIPLSLALIWFGYGLAEFIAAGIIASLIYRPKR